MGTMWSTVPLLVIGCEVKGSRMIYAGYMTIRRGRETELEETS